MIVALAPGSEIYNIHNPIILWAVRGETRPYTARVSQPDESPLDTYKQWVGKRQHQADEE